RMFPEGIQGAILVDGQEITSSGSFSEARWAHIEGVGGYLFPNGSALDATLSQRTGSTRKVERTIEDIPRADRVTREWATLELHHPEHVHGTWWVLLPAADAAETRSASSGSGSDGDRIQIVRNDATAQIVRIEGATIAAAVWAQATLELTTSIEIRCEHPALVLGERDADRL